VPPHPSPLPAGEREGVRGKFQICLARFWAKVEEFGNKYLRVVTLADGITIHNAFIDRGFKPKGGNIP